MIAVANKAKSIFLNAVELASAEERQAYLAEQCVGDDALRRDVADLLRHHGDLDGFLDPPELNERPGTMIGPYKLLEQIGEGGMGLVFMAEQTEPIRRKVALKIIKPGMDTRQVVVRFEAERQALAMMDHPNIAKILDAGVSPPVAMSGSDRPYFVMELVRGVPITEFCDQHRYTPKQRLALFVTVCQAVQHAHQKGIIHRDLKPSNILVTLHDTVAVPKIIDFGIAKALDQRLTERTLFTNFAQMIGTPVYMSPEQAEMNSLDADTRSDVYALGVLLYELLTGTTPFDSQKLKQVGFDEMRRLIREEDPPRPSQRVSTLEAAALTTLSERRGVDGRRFGATLRGDLDWIVMKALEKDRNRRYESAGALATDVQRYLNDEPVEACSPTAWYRVRKFARRHRGMLLVASIVAVTLIAATGVSMWQAAVARAAQRQASNETAIATAIKNFLQNDLLGYVSPQVPLDGGPRANPTLNVREALDRAAAKIDERFRDQPLVEAEMRLTVANAYRGIWETEKAILHFQRAIALRKAHLGSGHRDTLSVVHDLELAYEDAGRLGDALDLLAEWRERFQATFVTDDPRAALYTHAHARASYKARKLDDAERSARATLEIRRSHDPRMGTAYSLAWLSRIHIRQGKYVAAEAEARECLAIVEKETQEPPWVRSVSMTLLGGALVGREQYAEAEPLLLKGYQGLVEWNATLWKPPVDWKQTDALEWIVWLYEATKQPEKARVWQAKLPP